MNIAVLYICVGKYHVFWDDFFKTSQSKFLKNHTKKYFVFTDNDDLLNRNHSCVNFIFIKKEGWPYDTLFRYKYFSAIKDILVKYDYIYYINANALILEDIREEVFPDPYSLIGSQHPCFYDKCQNQFIYDRNHNSNAYIPFGEGEHYLMGAFIGGKAKEFLLMCFILKKKIDEDLENNIIALWHDESHLNKYLLNQPFKLLSPSYVYPEEMIIPFSPKIMLRDKTKYGGHQHLRGLVNNNIILKLFQFLTYAIIFSFSNKLLNFIFSVNIKNSINIRVKILKRRFNYLFFSFGGQSSKDKILSYYLRASMDKPFENRPKFVINRVNSKGPIITFRHKYFQNIILKYDLLDNFEMAICHEFFIQNTYNLSKLTFIPEKIIDCGAYKGYFSFLALKYFPKTSITAVEAHPINFEKIKSSINSNKIKNIELLHGVICRSESISVDLYFEGSNASVKDIFGYKREVTKVKAINLEELVHQENLLLKVDIEGAELDFFPYIINKLPSICAVFLETHNGWESLLAIKESFITEGFSFEIIRERSQFIDIFAQRK